MTKTSKITIDVTTNENNVPESINWSAEDGGVENLAAKAIILSLWDKKDQNAMRIDLWDKEMTVEEMKQFFHQTLVAMSDTFNRATDDEKMTATMKDFCDYFAEKMELTK